MLFNSYIFIFIFLPLALSGFFILGRYGQHKIAVTWLVACSLFFYGWWNPAFVSLIIFSILFNFGTGAFLRQQLHSKQPNKALLKSVLVVGVLVNLGFLGYFKYANFFMESVNALFDSSFLLRGIVLPLAISFYTFQQITYLVDSYQNKVPAHGFLRYCLFVTFFPQLIAGPIVHHSEMMPQFAKKALYRFNADDFSSGLTFFSLGLFKKVILADGIAVYATPVFNAALQPDISLTFFEAWSGALAYTLQLYFDFSGYSDMAVGLARMIGIRLPFNFNSPYKSTSIITFWRRWHMTLSRFLRDYLYFPLGGNRKGLLRRHTNIMAVMLIGGLWHGAGWTFVFWGGLHGVYLVVNHLWRQAFDRDKNGDRTAGIIGCGFSWMLTFLAIVVAWVFFRAETFDAAIAILRGMAGFNGFVLAEHHEAFFGFFGPILEHLNITYGIVPYFKLKSVVWIGFMLGIALFLPNSQQWINGKERPATLIFLQWQTSLRIALITGILGALAVTGVSGANEFLYFQF